jgi:hypothetical protein
VDHPRQSADTMADFHNPHGSQVPDARTQACPADLQRGGELALWWDFIARLQRSVLDQKTNVVDHVHRAIGLG